MPAQSKASFRSANALHADRSFVSEFVNLSQSDLVPIATPLHSYSGVNKDDNTIPRFDELLGFASSFGPASSRLGQILGNGF
jgi:hypothetical protein